MAIRPVILCGGSGTRLWPASRQTMPKQFLPLFKGKTLLDLTIERTKLIKNIIPPLLVTSKNHEFYIKEALQKSNISGSILLEPEGKNTTAAIYLSAKISNKKDILLIMSSDGLIQNNQYFSNKITETYSMIDNKNWIIFGVKPTYPANQYGYINVKKDEIKNNYSLLNISNFIEKPQIEDAILMLNSDTYFWNTGIFMGNVSMILESITLHAPDIAKACDIVFEKIIYNKNIDEINFDKNLFKDIPSKSIDYSVMEHAKNKLLAPLNCDWDDVGSWDALAKINQLQENKNKTIRIESKNTHIKNDNRVIATIGVEDLIIIDSDNATLIAKIGHTQKVKEVVEILKLKKIPEGTEHSFEHRPWGKFKNLLENKDCKVKKIQINPYQRLSLQYHNFRSEHWLIISGKATIYLDGNIKEFTSGMAIDIPQKSQHYIQNKTNSPVIIIETQLGSYFGEDDIIRLDDPYNR
jgi:mannose-1-phosphate guanylyltransferase/mannose-6-phosphate isomerase